MPTGQTTGYINKGSEEKNGVFGSGGPNFSVTSIFTQYSMAKFAGYIFQAIYSPGTKWVENHVLGNRGALIASPKAKQYFNLFEAAVFALISTTSFFMEKANFKNNIYDAMAAERGLNPENISVFSMYKSDNPFIKSLRDRFTLQNATRIPGSLLFAKNLTAGVVALSANFTLERSVFVENNAYDILRNMLYEVQKLKTTGTSDTERVRVGLERAVQRTLSDNHRLTLSEGQLLAAKPVFDRLTQNIMSGQFHMAESIYILGELANHPEHTERLLSELDKIEQFGIKGFARQKATLTARKTGINEVLEQGKRSFSERNLRPEGNLQPGMA